MNKSVLTLLGCSGSLAGSLALMLTIADVAKADTVKTNEAITSETAASVDITFVAPTATVNQNSLSVRSVNAQYATVDPASDTIGDLAIAKFRCDCNACRVAVVQLLQTGQLSL